MNNLILTLLTSIIMMAVLSACSGGGSGANTSVTSFELLDPTLGAGNKFGTTVAILPNGNIIISAPTDSTYAGHIGAVHLYNPYTQTLIASFYGDTAGDQLGSGSITTLANNNFVIASPLDDETVVDGGTVRLVDGSTGVQINMLAGDTANDSLGVTGITALANNNFVIVSQFDDETIVDGGTVRLVNGSTGVQINMLAGDTANDYLGNKGITALANNNFVIASGSDDEGGIVDAGSVRQMDGTTGNQIRIIVGSVTGDMSSIHVVESSVGDFHIISLPNKDNNSLVDSGFVTLIAE